MRRLRLTLLSNKFSWAQTEPAKPLLPLFLATLLAGLFIILSDASPTWLVLVFLACCAIGSAFWFGDLRRVMLFMLIFTTPIDISKALIVSGGVYSPGLSIVISDFFFLGLFALWGIRQFIVRHASIRFDHLHRTALLFLCWLWISAGSTPASRSSSSLKVVTDSTPLRIFCHRVGISAAPGKRPAMPIMAISEWLAVRLA